MGMVISGFAGIGKTTFCSERPSAIDLESSDYHWLFSDDFDGLSAEERKGNLGDKEPHPDWPENYVNAILDSIGEYNYVFICQDRLVHDMLDWQGIDYALCFPDHACKDEYLDRYMDRGNGEAFVNLLDRNFDDWVAALYEDADHEHVVLYPGQFVSDVL